MNRRWWWRAPDSGFLFLWTRLFCWVASPSHLPQLPRNASFISALPRTAHSQPSTKWGKTKSTQKKCAVAVCSRPVLWGKGEGEANCTNNTHAHSLPLMPNLLFSSQFIKDYYKPLVTWKRPENMEEQDSHGRNLSYHFLIPCVCSTEYGEAAKKRENKNQTGKLYYDLR